MPRFVLKPTELLADPTPLGPRQLSVGSLLMRVRDRVSDRLNDGLETGDGQTLVFPDEELLRGLDGVILDYSTYRPNQKETSITLVAGTRRYTLDVDEDEVLGVVGVDWTGNGPGHLPLDVAFMPVVDIDFLTNTVESWRATQHTDATAWRWAYAFANGAHRVELTPAPGFGMDGIVATVTYACVHQEVDGDYPTVGRLGERTLENLLVSRCLETVATDLLQRPNWRDGFTMEEFRHLDVLLHHAKKDYQAELARLR